MRLAERASLPVLISFFFLSNFSHERELAAAQLSPADAV